MGFTIYWYVKYPISKETWAQFTSSALKLINKTRTGPVTMRDVTYTGEVKEDIFRFEGAEHDGHETFYVSRINYNEDQERRWGTTPGFGSCKTARKGYTKDVYMCLIIMFELGMLSRINSDDMQFMFPQALEHVNQRMPLQRYDELLRLMNDENNNNNNNNTNVSGAVGGARKSRRNGKSKKRSKSRKMRK